MKRLDLGMIVGALTSLAVATAISGCSGDTTSFTQEAPLEPETPSNGTAIIVEGEGNGLTYTSIDGGVLIEANDGSQVTVYEATKVEDEDDNETEEE